MLLATALWTFLRALSTGAAGVALENLALRYQPLVLQRSVGRQRLSRWVRIFWVWLSRLCAGWRTTLVTVRPATVLAWHRRGIQLYWRWKSQARGNLRHAVSRIRKALPETAGRGMLRFDGQSVALDPSAVDVDVARFEGLVADGRPAALAQIPGVYRGDLLAGLALSERPFEEWLRSERERLHELAIQGLSRLLSHQQKAGCWTIASTTQVCFTPVAGRPLPRARRRAPAGDGQKATKRVLAP